jgi:hypothetical protein
MCKRCNAQHSTHTSAALTCAARPPDPWQQGNAPNQQPTRFIAATDTATAPGRHRQPCASTLSGNSCAARCDTAMTEFRLVSGSCASPAFNTPALKLSQLGMYSLGMLGPSCSCVSTPGDVSTVISSPSSTSSSAEGTEGLLLVLLLLQPPQVLESAGGGCAGGSDVARLWGSSVRCCSC